MTVASSEQGDETHTVHDPFTNQDAKISARLVDRLRGKYACGPIMENGEPEFGWRHFDVPPIQHEAAQRITELSAERDTVVRAFEDLCDALGCARDNEAALKAAAELSAEVERLRESIENANQAASETQPSWKHRCHQILAALGADYGDPDFMMPDQVSKLEQAESALAKVRADTIEECAQAAMNAVSMIPVGQVDASEFCDIIEEAVVAAIRSLAASRTGGGL